MKVRRNRVPLAANSDPDTSHLAAQGLSESGDLARRKAAVLSFVQTLSRPLTSHEIAKAIGGDRHEVAKRLPDLRDNDKAIENRGRRKCSITGRPALTWFAVDGIEAGNATSQAGIAQTAGSALREDPALGPEICARCNGAGAIRMRGTEPAVFVWCDEASGKACRFAESARTINPDANQAALAAAEASASKQGRE